MVQGAPTKKIDVKDPEPVLKPLHQLLLVCVCEPAVPPPSLEKQKEMGRTDTTRFLSTADKSLIYRSQLLLAPRMAAQKSYNPLLKSPATSPN